MSPWLQLLLKTSVQVDDPLDDGGSVDGAVDTSLACKFSKVTDVEGSLRYRPI